MSEQEILERYSTPGLRTYELTRPQKRRHLLEQGLGRFGLDLVDKLLDEIYLDVKP